MIKYISITITILLILVGCKQKIIDINDEIRNLPPLENISLADEATIVSLRQRIDSLSMEEIANISTTNLLRFIELEARISDLLTERLQLAQVEEVENMFIYLPKLEDLTIYYYEVLNNINLAYTDLNENQKSLFSQEKLILLQDYNSKMDTDLIPAYSLLESNAVLALQYELENTIPLETKVDLELPEEFTNGIVSLNLTWRSFSPNIINSFGEVKRPNYDSVVNLELTITGRFVKQTQLIQVKVKGALEVDLPPLDGSKKLTFAYLRNSGVGKNLLERDYMKIDVINYAFAKIVNGELSILALSNLQSVLRLRAKGVRVVVVIDGVSTDTREAFVQAASTSEKREKLAISIATIIEQYQFDGVDLDWEFPNGATEKNNFSLLLKTIREKLDQSPRKLILSAAVISGSYSSHYDLHEMDKYIDYLHIMSYGMNSNARHSSPLIKSTYASYAINSSVEMYINGGISRAKIVFGMPFYVKMGTLTNPGANVLGQTLSNNESVGYSNFMNNYFNQQGFVEYYDAAAMAYYAISPTRFASYDNPASVTLKCNWAIENNIAGVMFWDYGHDQAGGTLLEAIYQVFKKE